jgi:HEAT repeat protein
MLVLAALVLLQVPQEDAIRALIEQLGSDQIAARGEALKQLEKIGRAAIPALSKAAEDRDVEISSRARAALDRLTIREFLTPNLERAVPGLESRLLIGEWREIFVELAADFRLPEGQRRYTGVRADDLSRMAPMAILRARTESERIGVCEAVGRLRLKSAFPALFDFLKDEHPIVRMSVVTAARDADAREHAAALRPGLEDPHPLVRSVAAHALGRFGDRDSIPALRKLLGDAASNVRYWSVRSLGDLRAAEALPDLAGLRDDPDASVRRVAEETLPLLQRKP